MMKINNEEKQLKKAIILNCKNKLAPAYLIDCNAFDINNAFTEALQILKNYPLKEGEKAKSIAKKSCDYYIGVIKLLLHKCLMGEGSQNSLYMIKEAMDNALQL